jgi:hypothetical protein
VLLGTYTVIIAATQLDPAIWPTHIFTGTFARPVTGRESALAVAVGVFVLIAASASVRFPGVRAALRRWSSAMTIAPAVVLVLGVGVLLQQRYLDGRFAEDSPRSLTQDLHHERLGFVGLDLQQYPWYGPDLSNHVQFIGVAGAHGAFGRILNCTQWRSAINAGRYAYLIVAPSSLGPAPAPEQVWLDGDPKISFVRASQFDLLGSGISGQVRISLFRVTATLDPARCALLPLDQQSIPED